MPSLIFCCEQTPCFMMRFLKKRPEFSDEEVFEYLFSKDYNKNRVLAIGRFMLLDSNFNSSIDSWERDYFAKVEILNDGRNKVKRKALSTLKLYCEFNNNKKNLLFNPSEWREILTLFYKEWFLATLFEIQEPEKDKVIAGALEDFLEKDIVFYQKIQRLIAKKQWDKDNAELVLRKTIESFIKRLKRGFAPAWNELNIRKSPWRAFCQKVFKNKYIAFISSKKKFINDEFDSERSSFIEEKTKDRTIEFKDFYKAEPFQDDTRLDFQVLLEQISNIPWMQKTHLGFTPEMKLFVFSEASEYPEDTKKWNEIITSFKQEFPNTSISNSNFRKIYQQIKNQVKLHFWQLTGKLSCDNACKIIINGKLLSHKSENIIKKLTDSGDNVCLANHETIDSRFEKCENCLFEIRFKI